MLYYIQALGKKRCGAGPRDTLSPSDDARHVCDSILVHSRDMLAYWFFECERQLVPPILLLSRLGLDLPSYLVVQVLMGGERGISAVKECSSFRFLSNCWFDEKFKVELELLTCCSAAVATSPLSG